MGQFILTRHLLHTVSYQPHRLKRPYVRVCDSSGCWFHRSEDEKYNDAMFQLLTYSPKLAVRQSPSGQMPGMVVCDESPITDWQSDNPLLISSCAILRWWTAFMPFPSARQDLGNRQTRT